MNAVLLQLEARLELQRATVSMMNAANEHRRNCGYAVAYAEAEFDEVIGDIKQIVKECNEFIEGSK